MAKKAYRPHEKPVPRPGALKAPWLQDPDTTLTGSSHLTEVDKVAWEMEGRWGVGRLRLLVGADLREKFDRQRGLLAQAVEMGDVTEVTTQAARMVNAWRRLDRQAREDGQKEISEAAQVWEAVTPDGEVIAVVQDNAAAAHVLRSGRAMQVYTMAEIGRLLGVFGGSIGVIKQNFPGAVVKPHRPTPDPVATLRETFGDEEEIPF